MKTHINKKAQILFLLSTALLPGFVSIQKTPQLTAIDHQLRSSYAKKALSKKDQMSLSVESIQGGVVETLVKQRFEKAFPDENKSKIKSWVNTLINESNRAHLDPLYVMAIIEQESRFRTQAVGRHGEIGLMQIRPQTAQWISEKAGLTFKNADQLFNPSYNLKIGILYLGYLHTQFKDDVRLATSAYNMGPRRVRQLLAQKVNPEQYQKSVFRRYKQLYVQIYTQREGVVVASH